MQQNPEAGRQFALTQRSFSRLTAKDFKTLRLRAIASLR